MREANMSKYNYFCLCLEAVVRRCSSKSRCSQKFWKFHRKTAVLESFFNKVTTLLKRDTNTGFSSEISEIFKNTLFHRTSSVAASVYYQNGAC